MIPIVLITNEDDEKIIMPWIFSIKITSSWTKIFLFFWRFHDFLIKKLHFTQSKNLIILWFTIHSFCKTFLMICWWKLNYQSFIYLIVLYNRYNIKMLSTLSSKIFVRFASETSKVALPELKYGYSDLEPVLSSKLLELHHKKHHQTYVNNLNAALEQFECTFSHKFRGKIQLRLQQNGRSYPNH